MVGDTFDLIEARDITADSPDYFPILTFNDPAYAGTLAVASVGDRQMLRLTLTKAYHVRGTVVNIR